MWGIVTLQNVPFKIHSILFKLTHRHITEILLKAVENELTHYVSANAMIKTQNTITYMHVCSNYYIHTNNKFFYVNGYDVIYMEILKNRLTKTLKLFICASLVSE